MFGNQKILGKAQIGGSLPSVFLVSFPSRNKTSVIVAKNYAEDFIKVLIPYNFAWFPYFVPLIFSRIVDHVILTLMDLL